MNLKISIVTAVLNRSETIEDCIQNVACQTYRNFEHIIQDGGSTDATLDIIERCDNGSISVRSEQDDGIYDAINRGMARATGDIIGLAHSDDLYASPHVLEWVAARFADSSIDAVYGDLQYVSKDLRRVMRHWRSGLYTPFQLALGWMPPHPTFFIRRQVIERWGNYDSSMRIAADYDAMLRWILKGGIRLAYIPEVLVKMRVGGISNRSISGIVLKSREDFRAIRRNQAGGVITLVGKNMRKLPQFFIG